MLAENIIDLARQVSPVVQPVDVQPLSGGFSSQAYKVNANEPFVLLVGRAGGVSTTNYGNAYVVLTLLKRHGYEHAPSPLWIKDDHSALAISFFGGSAADKFDFTKNALDPLQLSTRVIDSLLDTAEITFAEYEVAAREFGISPLPVETQQESARKYGTEWFEIVDSACPDR